MKNFKKICFSLLVVFLLVFSVPSILPFSDDSISVEAATKPKLNKKTATLIKGQTLTLKVSGTKTKVKWSSSNKKVANVNSKGKIVAKSKGVCNITAKVGKNTLKCKLSVETPTINKKSIKIKVGSSYTLKLKGTKQKITWSSSNKNIATVNSKGLVKGKKAGKCIITAKINKKKYTCSVIVSASTVPISTFKIDSCLSVVENDYSSIDYTISPSNATNKTISWKSSDNSIATVSSSGLVHGIKPGTVKITATCGNYTDTCIVDVLMDYEYAESLLSYNSYIINNHDQSGVLIIVKNNYHSPICLETKCSFYNSSNELIGISSDDSDTHNYRFENGSECALFLSGPPTENYVIDFKVSKPFRFGNANAISTTSKEYSSYILTTAKNESNPHSEFTYVAIVFYKNNTPIGYNANYADTKFIGASDELKFYFPKDVNNNTIIPDSYKLYVNCSMSN
jgi:uncharacterized protein YjdB|nr:MAG TPA: Tail tube protein [Caudoviricetes sp.]